MSWKSTSWKFATVAVWALMAVLLACSGDHHRDFLQAADTTWQKGTYGYDVAFLRRHTEIIELGGSTSRARVVIAPGLQGRVMTSTASGSEGHSYGWINYKLIESGDIPRHIYPVGGEDRFWMGPEGGQFSIFFKKGDPFDFEHWQTPAIIDTATYDLLRHDSVQATFSAKTRITNYSGFTFDINIERQIRLLSANDINEEFGLSTDTIQLVGFESINSITNTGNAAWSKKTGVLSIWILGMLIPSDRTTLVIPHNKSTTGVSDDYFGTIPPDRITAAEDYVSLKADGKYRGKVGVAPGIAKNIAGSYDADRHILTLVKFDLEPTAAYVNSKWELQKSPYSGDAVNAYNDGPVDGGAQMGPFYELESSSPAKELKPGEKVTHRHMTVHIEGAPATLDKIGTKILGVPLTRLITK